MVVLNRQDVIRLLVDDGLSNVLLTAHGIDGDDIAFEVEQFDQQRQRGDLIGLPAHRYLAQKQACFAGPGTDQMQRVGALVAIVRATQRLAIQGHVRAAQGGTQVGQPTLQAHEQGRRIELGKDPAQGIVGGNAVGQFQKTPQEGELGFAEAFDIHPGIGIGHHAAQGQDQHVLQDMPARPFHPWIRKICKVLGKLYQGIGVWHPSPPGSCSVRQRHLSGTP